MGNDALVDRLRAEFKKFQEMYEEMREKGCNTKYVRKHMEFLNKEILILTEESCNEMRNQLDLFEQEI